MIIDGRVVICNCGTHSVPCLHDYLFQLDRDLAEAHRERDRLSQELSKYIIQLEQEEERADVNVGLYFTMKAERDSLRAEVDRLTSERDLYERKYRLLLQPTTQL